MRLSNSLSNLHAREAPPAVRVGPQQQLWPAVSNVGRQASNHVGEVVLRHYQKQGEFMGLIERLRKAEEQGKQATRDALQKAREFGEDAERRIRQKMRIYPPQVNHTESAGANSAGAATAPRRSPIPESNDEPIVSIHGEDVGADKVA